MPLVVQKHLPVLTWQTPAWLLHLHAAERETEGEGRENNNAGTLTTTADNYNNYS